MNPFAEEARRALNESSLINEWDEKERLILAARGQAEATLALAHEQRTANMIAFEALLQKEGASIDVYAIQARLDLA